MPTGANLSTIPDTNIKGLLNAPAPLPKIVLANPRINKGVLTVHLNPPIFLVLTSMYGKDTRATVSLME